MRLDSLRNRVIVDPDTASHTGIVTDYWIDARTGSVAALQVRPVDAEMPQRLSARRVARVGHDAIMLSRTTGTAVPSPADLPTDWLDRRHVWSLIAYTDTGERLGRVTAAEIDPASLAIQRYYLSVPLWRRWWPTRRSIQADSVAWCGRDVLVVRTDQPAKLRPVGLESGVLAELPSLTTSREVAEKLERNGAVHV